MSIIGLCRRLQRELTRTVPIPSLIAEALNENIKAKEAFEKLPPHRQKEISRYIGNLKSEEKVREYVKRTIDYLTGKKVKGVLYRSLR